MEMLVNMRTIKRMLGKAIEDTLEGELWREVRCGTWYTLCVLLSRLLIGLRNAMIKDWRIYSRFYIIRIESI